jgi:hypothetical protein
MNMRVVAAILVTALSFVRTDPVLAAEKHLLVGTWVVDVSRLDQPDPPVSVTMNLREAGGGTYVLTFDIVNRDGSVLHLGGESATPGGEAVPVKNGGDVDIVTFTMPNRRTLVMGAGLAGRPSHTRVWALSDDGKQMTETIVGHIDGKTPHIRTNYWRRK